MKKILFVLAVLLTAGSVFAEDAFVEYIEGWVDVKDTTGDLFEAIMGDSIIPGESIVTGDDGRAILRLSSNDSEITISESTVFNFNEQTGVDGKPQGAYSSPLGVVAYKFNSFAGLEPQIYTPSAVCGVRGTEFTVYTAADGSTVLAVDSGLVELTAQGETVELAAGKAVEVLTGQAPGDVYDWKGKELDFSAWNQSRWDVFKADPLHGLQVTAAELGVLQASLEELVPYYESLVESQEQLSTEIKNAREEGDKEAEDELTVQYKETARLRTITIFNIRYYALSYLSMRQYILTHQYAYVEGLKMAGKVFDKYSEFMDLYAEVLKEYNSVIMQRLVKADF